MDFYAVGRVVLGKTLGISEWPEILDFDRSPFPQEDERDCACQTTVLETVVAKDEVEFFGLVELVGEAVAVACLENFDSRICVEMFPEHCRFVVGVFVTENGYSLVLCGECFCKPGAEGRLSCASGSVRPDND